jgi:hypothetical protein
MLDLTYNKIGREGAEHLADALEHNTVRLILNSSILYTSMSFDIDAHVIKYCEQRIQCR